MWTKSDHALKEKHMTVKKTVKSKAKVVQFTVSRETKDGWMCDLVGLIAANGHYVLGIMGEHGAEMSRVRFISESPDEVRDLLRAHEFHFCEREVVVVRLKNLENLDGILRCLKAGEIGLFYAYGLIINAENRSGVVLVVDDVAMGTEVLERGGYEVLGQDLLSR
jgi:hypothetical protein